MPDQEAAQVVEGVVRARAVDGSYLVELPRGHCISAELSAKIKVRLISVAASSRVRCELSPREPGRARICEVLGSERCEE